MVTSTQIALIVAIVASLGFFFLSSGEEGESGGCPIPFFSRNGGGEQQHHHSKKKSGGGAGAGAGSSDGKPTEEQVLQMLEGMKAIKYKGKLFSKADLAEFSADKKPSRLMIAVGGQVFEVTKGAKHYGADGGYSGFTGRDGSRAFFTGDFSDNGLTDDLEGLEPLQQLSIAEWVHFYHRDYKYKGRVVGRFYNENGEPTDVLFKFCDTIVLALQQKKVAADERKRIPGCDMKWSQSEGGEVWCSQKSGGVERDWIGVPRQVKDTGSTKIRCGCVQEHEANNPSMRVYDGCDPSSSRCKLKQEKSK